MIFESGATDNTAQLGLCGGYRLGRVCPTSYAIGLSLRTTVESHTPSKWWNFEQFQFNLISFVDYTTDNTQKLWVYFTFSIPRFSPQVEIIVHINHNFLNNFDDDCLNLHYFIRVYNLLSSSQIEPIAKNAEGPDPIYVPTEAQLSSVVRPTVLKNNQNGSKSLEFSQFSQGIRLQNGSQVKPIT